MSPAPYASSAPTRLGSQSRGSGEGLDLIQQRIALFSKVSFSISAAFYVIGWFVHFSFVGDGVDARADAIHEHVDRLHLLGTLVFLVTWSIARRRAALSFGQLTAIDATTLVLGAAAFSAMAYVTGDLSGTYVSLLAIMCIVVMRAVLVPSEAVRTAWMSTLAVASLPVVAWLVASSPEVTGFYQPAAPIVQADRVGYAVGQGMWSLAIVVVATVTSRIIYGLHEQVRKARQLGQYTLEQKIGEGGMGAVYRARHAMLRRPTAIKLLRAERVGARQLERFEREVQLTAGLSHPNTISIYDYGRTPEGVFYYAMEYLDGHNLDDLVRAVGPLPAGRVIHLLRQACGALAEAHAAGLIHRDVKPANIIVCERGGYPDFVKVLDFGLVKDVTASGGSEATVSSETVITGTPLYLSPEAIRSPSDVDARSDIYALGCVAYFLLTGCTVFEGDSIVEICGHHLHTAPAPPSERLGKPIAEDLESLVLSCLAKSPGDRPPSVRALAERLSACTDAASWDEHAARLWWAQQPPRPARPSLPPASHSPATIEIDLAARRRRSA